METLNAYVDGELSATDSAALVRAMSNDSALAEQVVLLSRLKESVAELYAEVPCNLPDLDALYRQYDERHHAGPSGGFDFGTFNPFRFIRRPGYVLAGAVTCVFLAVAVWAGLSRPTVPTLVSRAIDHHDRWQRQKVLTKQETRTRLARLERDGRDIYVPDLSASKLSIVRVDRFGKAGLHVGYLGTRRCHLSLFIVPAKTLGSNTLSERLIGASRVFIWRENHFEYVLLAEGMDTTRLRLIAEDVYRATRTMQPFSRETRMALMLNREQSQPCTG